MKLHWVAVAAMLCMTTHAQEIVTKTKTIQWRANNSWQTWSDAGTVGLAHSFPIPAEGACRVDADNTSFVAYHDGGGVREGYITSPATVEMFFEVPDATKRCLWMLMRRGTASGEIEMLEGVDATYGGSISWVRPELADDDWHWVHGNMRDYRAGARELQLDRVTPGIEITAFVLSESDSEVPGEGWRDLPQAEMNVWPKGEAFTEYLNFAAVRGWRSARMTNVQLNGGRVGMRYSADHGETWEVVPEDGDLSGIVLRGDGTDDLRVRGWLIRAEDGATPTFGPLELSYDTDASAVVTVEDGTARIGFDRDTGAIVGLENLRTGTVLCSPDVPSPLFQLDIKQPGYQDEKDWEHLTSLDAKLVGGGISESVPNATDTSARFDYRLQLADGTIDVTVQTDFLGDGISEWRASVTNGLREREIAQLGYPVIGELRISDQPEDDTLMINAHYLWKIPAQLGRFCFYWPGGATAPWLDVFNDREGVALISHDETYRSTGQECKGVRRERCQLSMIKVLRVKPGESFSGEPTVLRVHEGDWHHTMLAERPWFNERWEYDDSVGWIEQADGWHTEGWPCPRWIDLGRYCGGLRERSGLDYASFWSHQVAGTSWTIPHFNPLFGSAEDLRQGIKRAHRAGMRVTFYIQAYLLDPDMEGMTRNGSVGYMQDESYWEGLPSLREGFLEHNAERNTAGDTHFWSPHEQAMCFGADEFGEYRYQWSADIYNKQLGADGQYWDSPAHAAVCWAEDHGHDGDPGLAALAHFENLDRIKRDVREDNPTSVFVGEGRPSGLLSQTLDFMLDNAPTLAGTRMLYPRLKILLGTSDGKDPHWHEAHLLACRLDGYDDAKYPEHRGIMWVRKRTAQYLYPADFRHTMGVSIEGDEQVQACLHICDATRTRGAAVTVLNPEGAEDARVTIDTSEFGPVSSGWVVSSDMAEGPLALEVGEGSCSFAAPAALASTILLLDRAEPRVTFTEVTPVARGGQTEVGVLVESLDGRACAGELTIQTPDGLTCAPARFEARGAGEAGARVPLMLTADDAAAEGLADLPVHVSVDGGPTVTRSLSVYVDDEPVHRKARWWQPTVLRVTLQNQSLVSHRGEVTLTGIEGEASLPEASLAPRQFELAPGEIAAMDFAMEDAADAQQPWTVRGVASYGRYSSEIYQTCWPGVLNGSMELHTFRKPDFSDAIELTKYGSQVVKNMPDWWWGQFSDRSPRMSRDPGEHPFAFHNEMAYDGEWSLRLDPTQEQPIMQYLFVGVTPGVRYRISARIRRMQHDPKTGMAIVQYWRDEQGENQGKSDKLGYVTDGPLGEWQQFETHATIMPGVRYCSLYFYGHGTEPIWIDEIRMVPDEE